MYSSSNQERWKYSEVGGQRLTGGLEDRSLHAVGSRGKAPVWGSGGLRLPEAIDFCLHALKILTSGDETKYYLYPIVYCRIAQHKIFYLPDLLIKTVITSLVNKVLNSFSLENHIESLTSILTSFHIMNFYNTCMCSLILSP